MSTENTQVQKYYDALIESYEILSQALAGASERGLKVTSKFAEDVAKGQREALELGKKLAGEPTNLGQYYTAVLEATTAAQGRALTFAQIAYQEALGAGEDTRKTVEKLVAANKETSQAALAVARQWASLNPFAEIARQNVQAFTAATKAPRSKKEKAAV